jgi:hypothetical protein
MQALELKFNTLLRELSTSLTETDIEQIRGLVNVGELGVAFENFLFFVLVLTECGRDTEKATKP